ncbi:unnamed protein product [Clonostachys rosea]|uniref:Uncharacterized protein n=1 Tax=Bionectria ochroleuca TaxID=29856 RepID=A0ABY6UUY9_BIOOC|nr:unnamed protein product [Clonostachys rosea]
MSPASIVVAAAPIGIPISSICQVELCAAGPDAADTWVSAPVYAADAASASRTRDADFNRHPISLCQCQASGSIRVRVRWLAETVESAIVRPLARQVTPEIEGCTITFVLKEAMDVVLEINGSKWKALHLLANKIDSFAPTCDSDDVWYFGPGVNQGPAYGRVMDGVNLVVPSGKTVYLALGAFVTFRLVFINVSNCAVRGPGIIYGPKGGYEVREFGGAIHMSGSTDILVQGVTAVGTTGFSLSAGECRRVRVDGYRAFTSVVNGDGIDFFCSSDIEIENCFLRTSDDCIALYSHRWDWYGDSKNITIKKCVLLSDVAHSINMGTHGNPAEPETTSDVKISDIDILDQDEYQLWYQGCIAINVADENLFIHIRIEDIRIERITRGQLFNLRVMENSQWTTAPGRGIKNVVFKRLSLTTRDSVVINPSLILGYDGKRTIKNIVFEDLKIDDRLIHHNMEKTSWFMASDFVPLFVNEHATGVTYHKS